MTLKSEFNPWNSFFVPLFFTVFLTLIGIGIGYLSYLELLNGKVDSIFKTPIYGSFILIGTSLILNIQYLQQLKSISITEKGILFKTLFSSKFHPWNTIQSIKILDRNKVMGLDRESTSLKLKSGPQLVIPEIFYRNIGTIRKALLVISAALPTDQPVPFPIALKTHPTKQWTPEPSQLTNMPRYSGNYSLTFNGIVLYGIGILLAMILINRGTSQNFTLMFLAALLFFVLFYSFIGHQAYYFYLDNKFLVVKNHLWPWVSKSYKINDIQEVVLESPYRMEKALRIVSKNFESTLYSAGSLKKKTWDSLERKLGELNIQVIEKSY